MSLRKRSDGNRRCGRCAMPFLGAVALEPLWPLLPIHHQVHAACEGHAPGVDEPNGA